MYLQKIISKKAWEKIIFCLRLKGNWRKDQAPDPFIRGTEQWIRICTKMSRTVILDGTVARILTTCSRFMPHLVEPRPAAGSVRNPSCPPERPHAVGSPHTPHSPPQNWTIKKDIKNNWIFDMNIPVKISRRDFNPPPPHPPHRRFIILISVCIISQFV